MNEIILDCCVQKEVKLFEEIANFNVSAITGKYKLVDGSYKNRFTYIRVIYSGEINEQVSEIIQPDAMIRIYGKLDSEQYTTINNKRVYNKVIIADKVVRIKYNIDTGKYEEVSTS
jgi:hypothetical protein